MAGSIFDILLHFHFQRFRVFVHISSTADPFRFVPDLFNSRVRARQPNHPNFPAPFQKNHVSNFFPTSQPHKLDLCIRQQLGFKCRNNMSGEHYFVPFRWFHIDTASQPLKRFSKNRMRKDGVYYLKRRIIDNRFRLTFKLVFTKIDWSCEFVSKPRHFSNFTPFFWSYLLKKSDCVFIKFSCIRSKILIWRKF